MENSGFDKDEKQGSNHITLENTTAAHRKVPTDSPTPNAGENLGSESKDATTAHAADPGGEVEEEDYSLLSFFFSYREHRARFAVFCEKKNASLWFKSSFFLLLSILYAAYFIVALSSESDIEKGDYWCDGAGLLLVLTTVAALGMLYCLVVKKHFGRRIYAAVLEPGQQRIARLWERSMWIRLCVYLSLILAVAVFLIMDTADERHRLVSFFGLLCFLLLGFLFSHAPRKIIWRHVVWGLGLQFVLGLLMVRWPVGKAVVHCAGNKVAALLAFTNDGTAFVFGVLVTEQNIIAFKVLPVVLFFSFCAQILYYYGIMQWVVIKLGWLLQVTIGTTACESVNAAASIFLGQWEAPLLIKPYLSLLTKSELHAVMTGCFATIAGAVMAAYISLGVSAGHLLSASVMSAPAALAFSKLIYPETQVTRTDAKDIKIVKSTESNALHAACEGVTTAIPLLANIVANLITFIAFTTLVNSTFDWACQQVNVEQGVCQLENVFGYLFMPLAWLMGVPWAECHHVGYLIGLKTIVNDFVAYTELLAMMKQGTLSARAEMISIYSLCGCSNISAVGIMVGTLSTLAPERGADVAKLVVRAMVAGSAACCLTACVAGTLLDASSLPEGTRNLTWT